MAVAAHQIKPLQMWSGRTGHCFLFLASIITGYGGWVWGNGDLIKSTIFAGFMALCPWAVARLVPFYTVARQAGRDGTAALIAAGVLIAGAMEWRAEMMVFAGQRQTSAVTAQVQNARLDDVRRDIVRLEREVASAQETLEKQRPYGASASYDPQIVEADDRAAREDQKRGGKGKNYDAAKAKAADLRAKQAIARDREIKTEPLVDRLRAELADAKTVAANTKPGDSMSSAESDVIASLFTGNLEPSQSALKWTDRYAAAFMALFLLIVPTVLIYTSVTDWEAPRPDRKTSQSLARLAAWLKGETYKAPVEEIVKPAKEPEPAVDAPAPRVSIAPKAKRYAIETMSVADLMRAA